MKKLILFLLCFIFIGSSCKQFASEKGTLTDEKVKKYIKIYKKLREQAPEILENLNKKGESAESGKESFKSFEKIIKEGGLKDFKEFVVLNAKIGAIFSLSQAVRSMENVENIEKSSQKMFSNGQKIIQEQLDDPDVPEETKIELRKTLKELKKSSSEITTSYVNKKKLAEFVMEKAEKISGYIVDKNDIEVIKRHEEEIYEAYTGFPRPEEFDGTFPDLDIEF